MEKKIENSINKQNGFNKNESIKQYIIVRDDLSISVGKLAAQVAHASMKIFFDKMIKENVITNKKKFKSKYFFFATKEEVEWIDGMFTKIVKKVKNENQLMKVYNKAKDLGLNVSIIKDAGLTELSGENITAIAIGPNHVDKCKSIVKRLRNV